jgi:hypothetical protein
MATKNYFVFILFFISLSSVLQAQQTQADSFAQTRFYQRLHWIGDENALRYEIIVEKEEDGVYVKAQQLNTTEYSIIVSLTPGKYRYRVIPYDYLDHPAPGIEWIEFEVIPAFRPEVDTYTQEFNYRLTRERIVINLLGRNLHQKAEIILKEEDGTVFSPNRIDIAQDGSSIRLVFNNAYLLKPNFFVEIINPGGLYTKIGVQISIYAPLPQPFDIYLNAAMMPMISLFGTGNWIQENDIALPGAALRAGVIYNPDNTPFGIGIDVCGSFFVIDLTQLILIDINAMTQVNNQRENMALKFRAGFGFSNIINENDKNSKWQKLHFNFGASCLWVLWQQMYLEAGIDCVSWSKDGIYTGILRPSVGLGWRF